MCWLARLKVATNSKELPGPKKALVPMRAPSEMSEPPATLELPPVPYGELNHPDGSAVPENSAPTVGARVTSPSAVWEMYVFTSGVPALKSATVVSVKLTGAGGVVLIVQVELAG